MSKFFEATLRRQDRAGARGLFPDSETVGPSQKVHTIDAAPLTDNAVRAAADPPFRVPAGFRVVSVQAPAGAPSLSLDSAERSSESYRIIRTKIVQHPLKPTLMCVSSSTPGDGKTVTAMNIAGSLALKRDTTAILVDADLRRPRLSELLGIPPGSPGLAEVLAGTCSIEDAVVRVADLPSLHFLPAGRSATNPTELLDSDCWRSLVDWMQKTFTFAILDSPPVGMVADYDLIQSVCQGVLLVVRPGHTNRKLLQKTIDQMPPDSFLGVVVNAVDDWFLWRTQGNYYDGYYRCQNQE
jgi:capsular exopolysaccharide synthesis family protein